MELTMKSFLKSIVLSVATTLLLSANVFAQTATVPSLTTNVNVEATSVVDPKRDLAKEPLSKDEIAKLSSMPFISFEGFPDGDLNLDQINKFLSGKKVKGFTFRGAQETYYFLPSGQLVMVSTSQNGVAQGTWVAKPSVTNPNRSVIDVKVSGGWDYAGTSIVNLKEGSGYFGSTKWFTFK